MKCQKVVIACINVNSEGFALIGLDGQKYIEEITTGAVALKKKYGESKQDVRARKQDVLTVEVFLTAKVGANEALAVIPLTDKQYADIKTFAGTSQDAGLYVIAHHESGPGYSGGAFYDTTLAEFVNKLPFVPRKICIVACDSAGKTGEALIGFCKALTLKPPPLVAGYKLPVFIKTSKGYKTVKFTPDGDRERVTKDRDKAKVYYQQGTSGAWTQIAHSKYHDEAFLFES